MKLILAIVNNDASALAASALMEAGFWGTKLSTTGGFLMVGNTTLLIGTENDQVDKVMELLKSYCKTRKHIAATNHGIGLGMNQMSFRNEVTVGGATVFVLDVDHMEKI